MNSQKYLIAFMNVYARLDQSVLINIIIIIVFNFIQNSL